MRLFIIGPMASGKSLLGRKLSEYLDLPYVDTDKEIDVRVFLCIARYCLKQSEILFTFNIIVVGVEVDVAKNFTQRKSDRLFKSRDTWYGTPRLTR